MSAPQVHVHPDADELARAVAAEAAARLAAAIAARGSASIVLTGGGIGTKVLAQLAAAPARDVVDWSLVNIWWGDERFVPSGDPERNETGARSALLDQVAVDPARVHVMAPSDGPDGDDPEAAAQRYAAELAAAAPAGSGVPAFDVLLLGIGPEGHVASLFPGLPAVYEAERSVLPVYDSPKPPPTRLTLTFPAIRAAREVWIVASGAAKAEAVGRALAGSDPAQVPAAGARGRELTLFLIDEAAAVKIPSEFGPA
jgi:6-phosphogluconolactonase